MHNNINKQKEWQRKSPTKADKSHEKTKKAPPFAHADGKVGDTKQWNGTTYYFCLANHKYSHWHTHKVEDCNTYKKHDKEKDKKELTNKSNQVTVDADTLKKGMAALFPSGDFDTEDLAEALSAAIANIE